MALSRARKEEIPTDAVLLSEEQALTYQWKIISNWENSSEVWSLRHAPGLLGTLAALTGLYVNSHYRNKMKLGNYGRVSTYLPIVVIPAMFTVLAHKFFVQRSIILDPIQCPVCMPLRAATFQGALGVAYPMILAPLSAFMFATRHYTYRLPSVTKEPMEILKLWRKITLPIMPTLGAILVGNTMLAMYFTFKEMEQYVKMQLKMQSLEQRLEDEHIERTF